MAECLLTLSKLTSLCYPGFGAELVLQRVGVEHRHFLCVFIGLTLIVKFTDDDNDVKGASKSSTVFRSEQRSLQGRIVWLAAWSPKINGRSRP